MKQPRLGFALSLALLAGLLAPTSGLAATTIGQAPPTNGAAVPPCALNTGHVQSTVDPSGGTYTVPPGGGVITKWSHQAESGSGTLALQVFSDDAPATFFTPLAESAVATTTPSTLNTFDTRIPVAGGELIGMRVISGQIACRYLTPFGMDQDAVASPAPLPGAGSSSYGNVMLNLRINVAAVIEPDADGDGFGDETQDSCPVDPNAQDCIDPEVTIDRGPKKQTKKRGAKFLFSSNEAAATFECSVDGKPFTPCSSPLKVKKLKRKKHTFAVHAVDGGANRSADALYKWKVKKKKKK